MGILEELEKANPIPEPLASPVINGPSPRVGCRVLIAECRVSGVECQV